MPGYQIRIRVRNHSFIAVHNH